MQYIIGQILGLIATAVDVSISLFKKKWQMLIMNITVNVLLGLNLVFLGEIGSGIFLFAVAVGQGILNLIHTLRGSSVTKLELGIFFFLYVGLGFYGLVTGPTYVPGINAGNLLELLPILGAVLSMCFISIREERKARKFLLGCNIVWSVYNAIIGSTAFFGSFIGIVVGSIAIWKYRKKPEHP